MLTGATSLPYGIYYGSNEIRQEVPGFSISLLKPALRAEDVPLHTHENASLVFVLSGSYRSGADGAKRAGSGPMLIFNPAGTTHRDSFVLADGRFLAVSISGESLRAALDWGDLPGDAAAFVDGDGVNTALRFAEQLALRNPASCSMEAMCWELVSTVTGVKFWPDNAHPSWKRRAWVGQARELLRDRCSDSMHIAEMARQLEVHPVYFARAFRQVFHCTPGEYRMRCRLRDAMALLQNAEFPLSEIAYRSGFFDQSHFTNSFREHFGISPYAYRSRLGSIGTRRSFAAEPY